jgi:hypothetical protein
LQTYAAYDSSTSVPFGSQNYYATEMTADGDFYSPPCTANPNILMYPADVSSEGFVNYSCIS